MIKLLSPLLGVFFAAQAEGQEFLIFGGDDHDVFLGCLNCNAFASDAICNEFGAGSEFKSESIFNEFGKFGSEFSSSSPWNEFTSSDSVPVVVDREGNFYGYLTINTFRSNAVSFSKNLAKIYDVSDGDLGVVRNLLCQ
ncbi:hypothetical protein [Paracoccus litorisediminis]|uniref:Uncharacterized protein n=1 Tax=Paracoccus litorisediminis TaxID=2006130 RepID=A0A844HES1_9RHOB|nr:hypothetical protein [Paracoccus litorisediminis]MTH57876.1 hypothetical protein [Paracoccus litorisediminis]